jgi:2,3,4,5-tetrahydropyridine-2-carboxylate N-succinyltransferase
MMHTLQQTIERAWDDRSQLEAPETQSAIREVIEHLDKGRLRVAAPTEDNQWVVHEWVKKAVILYFPIQKMETIEVGPFEFYDKIPLKRDYAALGVRVVPHAIARHGCFLESEVILMPSYVNIGAYVGSGTMVDTWATVGSCGQIGGMYTSAVASVSAACWSLCRRPLRSSKTIVLSVRGASWWKASG